MASNSSIAELQRKLEIIEANLLVLRVGIVVFIMVFAFVVWEHS